MLSKLQGVAFVQPPSALARPGVGAPLHSVTGEQRADRVPDVPNSMNTVPILGLSIAGATVLAAKTSARRARATRSGKTGQSLVAAQAFETETGVQPPVGFWDPLGLSADGSEFTYKRRREVELKHGRLSMAATIGYMVPEYYKFPGYLSPTYDVQFSDVPNGLGALSKVPALGWCQIVGFAGLIELNVYNEQVNGEPGNYGAGFLGLRSVGIMSEGFADPEQRKKKLNAELANGRLAMMAIIGMFFQDGLTGSAWGDWALYSDSPLRSGKMSPGFNTLPEFEKPSTGFQGLLGDQPPLGYWDPVGFTKDGDLEKFKRRREVEIKHGRVCMLATIGYMVPEYVKLPGYLSPSMDLQFADVPNGLGALSKVPTAGWAQILAFAGAIELGYNKQTGEPGNYGKGFLGLGSVGVSASIEDPEVRVKKLAAELANGRLAMVAIIGMFFQDGLTGSAWGDWALYTDSPLRAFEGELGVQPPFGFWDPLGYSADGDAKAFRRRRETELKHGRVSMIACIGYITPEYFKFPGYLSPTSELSFSDVPNGLKAFSTVPALGWVQMFLFCGLVELGLFRADASREPGDFEKAGILGVPNASGPIADSEARTRKLSAELANGRLAMMAIIGMLFQDGLTGSAWGDWSLYTDSPLRARPSRTARQFFGDGGSSSSSYAAFDPANEAGVQDPVGFWDPLGLSDDKDEATFKRRRAVEIKHGRICMYATIGYMVPEYYKFPGYLSPSQGLQFADVPNGLGALSKVPLAGWLQILAFAGIVETTGFFSGSSTAIGFMKDSTMDGTPGDYGIGFPNFIGKVEDPEAKQNKLAAELANGRLAMVAIIGMFFQDGLTGSAWGDWSLYTASPLRAAKTC